jgi:hypothetical protein
MPQSSSAPNIGTKPMLSGEDMSSEHANAYSVNIPRSLDHPRDNDIQSKLLMDLLMALHVDGYPRVWSEGTTSALVALFDSIVTSRESYRMLLEYSGDEAQLIIEAIQLVRPSLAGHNIRTLMLSI